MTAAAWLPPLAHLLTGLRLALAAPLFAALRSESPHAAALAAACLAAGIASDWLDGRVARRCGTASAAGRLFDHCTDGTFVVAGLCGGAVRGVFPWLLPALVVGAFAQYVLDSLWLRRAPILRMSTLGRWNGILYFAPLVGDTLVRLGLPALRPAVSALAWALAASTLLSMLDRALALRKEP